MWWHFVQKEKKTGPLCYLSYAVLPVVVHRHGSLVNFPTNAQEVYYVKLRLAQRKSVGPYGRKASDVFQHTYFEGCSNYIYMHIY